MWLWERKPFQSTLPARGATLPLITLYIHFAYFNPRSPHGERPEAYKAAMQPNKISIHAPRTGSDDFRHPPERAEAISIHAPRTGSDRRNMAVRAYPENFNPRSPHGERHGGFNRFFGTGKFQSTLPARGATAGDIVEWGGADISIHAPRTGSDNVCLRPSTYAVDFNPRSPHGERLPGRTVQADAFPHFNPRSPHGERRSHPAQAC